MPCRAVDSTGIRVKWQARKHGGPQRRVRRRIDLGIDGQTLENRAVEITGSQIADAPGLPNLPGRIPAHEETGSVTGSQSSGNCASLSTQCSATTPCFKVEKHRCSTQSLDARAR